MTLNKSYKFEGVVELESSLSHIGETVGTDSLLRREKIIQPNWEIEEVMVISGNSFRGQLRDCGMLYFIEKCSIETMPLVIFHFLMSGGALTAAGGRGLDIDFVLRLRKLVPFVSLMGGAYGNQIMSGKLACGKMYPLSLECQRQIPDEYHEKLAPSWRLWLQEEEYTRTDDSKNVNLRQMIETTAEKKEPQQMRYSIETIAAGARFYHRMDLFDVSEIELGAFCSALTKFSERPFLGGMSRMGLGRVNINYNHCTIGTQIKFAAECQQAQEHYDEYLAAYAQALHAGRDEIREVLQFAPTSSQRETTE